MFSQAWNIYLPIIKILMKRSAKGNQTLNMNRTDFERAAGGRKAKLTFSIALDKGKIRNISNLPPVAKELATLLQEDETTRLLLKPHHFDFSMNSAFQLSIINTTPQAEAVTTEQQTNQENIEE